MFISLIMGAMSINQIRELQKENDTLREKLRTTELDNATKQQIIVELNERIRILQTALEREKMRNVANDQKIHELSVLIDSLTETRSMVS